MSPVQTLLYPLLALVTVVAPGASSEPETLQRRAALMGTWLSIELEAEDRDTGLSISELAFEAVRAVEARLSTWGDSSELALLNRAPVGTAFALSDELRAELESVVQLWKDTDGCFDPGVGALVEAWGLRSGGRKPSEAEIAECLAPGGLKSLALEGSTARRLHASLRIEEGGFGKGAALGVAIEVLRNAGVQSALIDLGGQVSVLGDAPHEIPVAHPHDRESAAVVLSLDRGSLATSGNSERAIDVEGTRRGHILDPRTGRPVADFGSITVWAQDGLSADALSTALFVMGPDRALAWATEHDGIEVLVMQPLVTAARSLRVRATAGLIDRLQVVGDHIDVELSSGNVSTPALPSSDGPGAPASIEVPASVSVSQP